MRAKVCEKDEKGRTPLMYACQRNKALNIINLLLDHDAKNKEDKDIKGNNLLL